jgi:hypothetical protein
LHDRLLFGGRAKITIGASAWKNFPKCTREMVSHLAAWVQDCFRYRQMIAIVPRVSNCIWFTAALAVMIPAMSSAATRQVTIAPAHADQFIGSAGCKSSSCHGGAGEKRSQYITWTQQDFHSRAYAVLVNARSARIAETLRLGPAQTSSRCTVCHSPLQSLDPSRLTASARADEGVSCESCHSSAERWFRGHTRSDWTYSTRIAAGMRDLRNFYVRANTCVACHQNLESDVLAAGHPELRFELDGQSVAEPKHWRDDPGTGAKVWLVGQAVALREMSWQLGKSDNMDAELVARWSGLAWLLGRVTGQQSKLPLLTLPNGPAVRASFIDMQGRADALARAAAAAALGDRFERETLQSLLATDSEFQQSRESTDVLWRRAQALVPAVNRLAVAAGLDTDGGPRPETRQLLELVQRKDSFERSGFIKALVAYRDALNKSPGSD